MGRPCRLTQPAACGSHATAAEATLQAAFTNHRCLLPCEGKPSTHSIKYGTTCKHGRAQGSCSRGAATSVAAARGAFVAGWPPPSPPAAPSPLHHLEAVFIQDGPLLLLLLLRGRTHIHVHALRPGRKQRRR